jgi:hypothetical protein
LGKENPPQQVEMDGTRWILEEVFKHDSWAATAVYSAGKAKAVVKFNRRAAVFLLPMGWLGRWLAARERRAYAMLDGNPGIPAPCGPVWTEDEVLQNAFAHLYIDGHPLARHEQPGDEFFNRLEALVRSIHTLKMAYLDLNKRENVIVTEAGTPALVDFQIHFCAPDWMGRLAPGRWLLRQLQDSDLYHLRKLRLFHTLGPDAPTSLPVPWSSHLWRILYVHPVQWLRRRLLVVLGIRSGLGHAISERDPEKAVRLESAAKNSRRTGGE